MSRPTKFSAIPYDLLDTVTDRSAIFMYAWLRRFSDWNTGDLQCTLAELASRSHSDIGTVRRALKILQVAGVVALVGDRGKQRWVIDPPTELLHPRKYSDEGRKSSNRDGGSGLRLEEFPTGRRDRTVLSPPTHSTNPHTDAPGAVVGRSVDIFDQGGSLLPKREIQDQNKQARGQDLRVVGEVQERETDPRSPDKPRQVAFGLEVQEPETLDPERLLAGDYDGKPDDPRVIRAAIALWSSAWSMRPGAVIVTKSRQKAWTEAMRAGCTPSHYARAILGMRWETTAPVQPGDFNRFKCCDFEYITRRPDAYAAVFDERGDPRQTPGFIPGKTFLGSPAPGGGRGVDRAHGGSEEVLSGQAALDKVAAETRARRERDRKQAEESSTPEAIEARRLAFEAMDAITARKGGGRR